MKMAETTETTATNQYQELNVYSSEVKTSRTKYRSPTIFWEYYSSCNKIKCYVAWIVKLKANWLRK